MQGPLHQELRASPARSACLAQRLCILVVSLEASKCPVIPFRPGKGGATLTLSLQWCVFFGSNGKKLLAHHLRQQADRLKHRLRPKPHIPSQAIPSKASEPNLQTLRLPCSRPRRVPLPRRVANCPDLSRAGTICTAELSGRFRINRDDEAKALGPPFDLPLAHSQRGTSSFREGDHSSDWTSRRLRPSLTRFHAIGPLQLPSLMIPPAALALLNS